MPLHDQQYWVQTDSQTKTRIVYAHLLIVLLSERMPQGTSFSPIQDPSCKDSQGLVLSYLCSFGHCNIERFQMFPIIIPNKKKDWEGTWNSKGAIRLINTSTKLLKYWLPVDRHHEEWIFHFSEFLHEGPTRCMFPVWFLYKNKWKSIFCVWL